MAISTKTIILPCEEPKRILIVNVCNPLSLGGAAVTVGLIKSLKRILPNSEITCMVNRESDISIYRTQYSLDDIRYVNSLWLKTKKSNVASLLSSMPSIVSTFSSCLIYNVASRLGFKTRNPYGNFDLVLDLSVDSFNPYYGIPNLVLALFGIELSLLSRKKVVICPASMGPLRNSIIRGITRSILMKLTLIYAREETSRDFLVNLGIPESKIRLSADLAFLFESLPISKGKEILKTAKIKSGRPLIAVAPSSEISRYCFPEVIGLHEKYQAYVNLMAETTDFLIAKLDADILFIPHFVFPNEFIKNDKIACQDIYQKIGQKQRVTLLLGNFAADEIKSVFRGCDLVLSCRMHAAIASTSSGIPTVVLAFGHKFYSVIGKMLGQEACVVSCNQKYDALLENLKSTIQTAWENAESIKAELKANVASLQSESMRSLTELREVLEK